MNNIHVDVEHFLTFNGNMWFWNDTLKQCSMLQLLNFALSLQRKNNIFTFIKKYFKLKIM